MHIMYVQYTYYMHNRAQPYFLFRQINISSYNYYYNLWINLLLFHIAIFTFALLFMKWERLKTPTKIINNSRIRFFIYFYGNKLVHLLAFIVIFISINSACRRTARNTQIKPTNCAHVNGIYLFSYFIINDNNKFQLIFRFCLWNIFTCKPFP